MLPERIKEKINGLSEKIPLSDWIEENQRLSTTYRNRSNKILTSDRQKFAYLVTRLPAIYAALCQIFIQLQKRSSVQIESLLDIGAGPGTVLLAASAVSMPLKQATMIEKDSRFIHLGKELCASIDLSQHWICHDLRKNLVIESHDLVVASYSFNELNPNDRMAVLQQLWKWTKQVLILVEPGTPKMFECLKKVRDTLLNQGGYLIAPCPHPYRCPLQEKDWCHFSARVERSSLHRKAKRATLNYEDEKFSYFIFSKQKIPLATSRVIRRPYKGKGIIKLQLCSSTKIEEKIITKKNKQQYLFSKKIEWGDEYY